MGCQPPMVRPPPLSWFRVFRDYGLAFKLTCASAFELPQKPALLSQYPSDKHICKEQISIA